MRSASVVTAQPMNQNVADAVGPAVAPNTLSNDVTSLEADETNLDKIHDLFALVVVVDYRMSRMS